MSTIYAVPCTPNGSATWKQKTQLDGVDFVLVFQWLQRDGHWLLHVQDSNEVPIASGLKLVTNWPLLRGVVDPRRPAGELVVIDTTGANDLDPGFADLGDRFSLSYLGVV